MADDEYMLGPATPVERLPAEVMTDVLEYVDISVRVKLASCNTRLEQLVYRDCPSLWVDLDLSNRDFHEWRLDTFLRQIKAREVTRSLCLRGCKSRTGWEQLMPLRRSQVLERIDVRGWAYPVPNPDRLLNILRTTFPYSLTDVRFPKFQPQRQANKVDRFLKKLRAKNFQSAREQGLLCHACQGAVADEHLVATDTGYPGIYCGACRNSFCRRHGCTMGVTVCTSCNDPFCDDCDEIRVCLLCERNVCKVCGRNRTCDTCHSYRCGRCTVVHVCSICKKAECFTCDELDIRKCWKCENFFCPDCQKVSSCNHCGSYTCSTCADVNHCPGCEEHFCSRCSEQGISCSCGIPLCPRGMVCDIHNTVSCKRCHGTGTCDGCNCSCEIVSRCNGCGKSYCDACSSFLECQTCRGSFCTICYPSVGENSVFTCNGCNATQKCDCCNESVRSTLVNDCNGCHGRFCQSCRGIEVCGACSKAFCNDECGFMEHCEICETNFCGDCETVIRCTWCGKASCENCKLLDGFCLMCEAPPSKKTKVFK